jgi:RNase P/RNase MRP subunit p29
MEELRLAGSKILKIEAERNPEFSGQVTMETNIKLSGVESIKEAKDTLKASYTFEVNYSDLGKVKIEGQLFIKTTSKIAKELQKSIKDKKYDSPENIAITNLIIQKASIKAFEIEEELGLPIHIRLPAVEFKKKE